MDYTLVAHETASIYRTVEMRQLAVDKGNAGEPILEWFAELGVRTVPIGFNAGTKKEMVNYFRLLRQGPEPILVLPRVGVMSELDAQLAEQELVVDESPTTKFRHPSGRHDDLLWALLMACRIASPSLTGTGAWIREVEEIARGRAWGKVR